ncbi:MAG TPA: SDR family oxidoreductase [Chloroflexota bacterium]|nr:SDR family oxidoreductase [Chloroflexota bacterium]
MLLENKKAVIYGAGGAVGGAVARAFAREGAQLFLAGRTLARVAAVAEEITAAGGLAEAAQVDALDERAVEAHIAGVVEQAGRIDALFNAIGMQDVQGKPLVEMSLEDYSRPIGIATTSQFLTARAVARRMIEQGSGVILTITAGPARRAVPHVGGFDVACAAIEALWRTFAAELGPYGVRLVVIGSAGSPDTPDVQQTLALHARATGRSLDEVLADSGSDTLLGRLPRVAEVANAAAIMASDYASAMTGAIANVTCGYVVD